MDIQQRLSSFLRLSAEVNSAYGVSNYYEFTLIGEEADEDEIRAFSKFNHLGDDDIISIFPLLNWKEQILRQFPDSEEYWLEILPTDYGLEGISNKQYLVQMIEEYFSSINCEILKVSRIEVKSKKYYACSSEEYVFVTKMNMFLLSFQVHD